MKSMPCPLPLAAALAGLIAAATPATAEQQIQARGGPPLGLGWRIQGGVSHQLEADLDEGGDFDVTRASASAGLRYAFGEGTWLALSAGYGLDDYDFSGDARLGGGSPWSEIHSLRLSLPVFWQPTPDWQVVAIPRLQVSAERAGDWDEGLTGGAILGFSYRFTDRLKLGPGFGFGTELEEDVRIFPIVLLDWKVTDRLRLETGRGLGAANGPGVLASYTITERWKASVGFRRERLRFRLEGGGVGEQSSFPVSAGITWGPPFASLSLFAGVDLAGQLRVEDEDGRSLVTSDYDPAAVLGLSFRLLL